MSGDNRPLAIDMFCGISGWGAGLIAAGWRVIGFDIENMFKVTDEPVPEHFSLVIQDVLTIHGSQFKDAALIVSSSPCQAYSWMAMPWSLAKAKRASILADETGTAKRKLNELFDAQFRIQREACEAAGRHIPMVVENVRGAQEWVGRAAGSYGSYYLWGDVPAMLPNPVNARKVPGFRFDGSGGSFQTASVDAHIKVPSEAGRSPTPGLGARFTSRDCGVEAAEGRKGRGRGAEWFDQNLCQLSSNSSARKAASAKIAKIPLTLSRYIGDVFHPDASDKHARAREVDLFSDWG